MLNTEQKQVHVALLTGGVFSAYAAYEVVKKYGKENCKLVYIDDFTNHLDDKESNTNFMLQFANKIGIPLVTIKTKEIGLIDAVYNNDENVFYSVSGTSPEFNVGQATHTGDDSQEIKDLRYLEKISREENYLNYHYERVLHFLDHIKTNENLEPIIHVGVIPQNMQRRTSACFESIDKFIGTKSDIKSIFNGYEVTYPLNDLSDNMDIKKIVITEIGISLPRSERTRVHIAMFSGGAGSAYVAYHMVQTYGKDKCKLFFTNTLWEDSDNLRFMDEVAEYIGIEITEILDGRTPEEVFYDYRYLGNSRLAKCSEELKVRQTLIFLEELRDNENLEPILYFGIGPHEKHRRGPKDLSNLEDKIKKAAGIRSFYEHFPIEPIETRFPLIETIRKDLDAKGIIQHEWGINLPRMYTAAIERAYVDNDPIAQKLVDNKIYGFSHANCGGRCVRGGFQHYATLFAIWPDQYREQEEMEERFREHFDKNVSILKKDGKAYTLKQYREDIAKYGIETYLFTEDETIPCVCSFS
jgi:diphthamide synthase (EF-2-diphthine--ammonia ligase)